MITVAWAIRFWMVALPTTVIVVGAVRGVCGL